MIFFLPPPRVVEYEVRKDGERAGVARLEQTVGEKGKTVRLRVSLKRSGGDFVVTSENRYDVAGVPLRKFMERSTEGGPVTFRTDAVFAKSGVTVTVDRGKTPETVRLANPATASVANAAENWFSRFRPGVGDRAMALVFSFERMDWQGNESTYVGDETWRGRPVHRVTIRQNERVTVVLMDDDGIPLRLEDPSGVTMEVGE